MSSNALKALAVVMVIAAAILGFVAYSFTSSLTAPESTPAAKPVAGENQVLAVVAVKRIPAYRPITQDEVSLVPITVHPAQYFTDVAQVVGRTPFRAVPVGSPVTNEAFGAANGLAEAIPPGTQAMSLQVSDVIAVGGFVKPGDLVDVLVYIRSSGKEVRSTQARVLLKNARVLAYHDQLISSADENGKKGKGEHKRTAVVAVPDDDTTRVMLGASLGELRLALRGSPHQAGAGARIASAKGKKMPEAVAPVAERSAPEKSKEKQSKNKNDLADKVVTLRELARIERRRPTHAGNAPRRAAIEVFEGTHALRISRPY